MFDDFFHCFLLRYNNADPSRSKEKVEGSGMVVTPQDSSSKVVSEKSLSCQLPPIFSPKKASIGPTKTGEAVGL